MSEDRSRLVAGGSRRGRTSGFTLVELLVVIGIIAALIAVLLPALQTARRAAQTSACQSNMRQIALSILQYANNYRGQLMPFRIGDGGADVTEGEDFWPNYLVRGGFLGAPNSASLNGPPANSVFRCPSGTDEKGEWASSSDTKLSGKNFGFTYPFMNGDVPSPVEGLAVYTWYSLNATNHPLSSWRATPFCFKFLLSDFTTSQDHARKLQRVRRASEMVMVTEGGAPNQVFTPSRIAARHGTPKGRDALTNIAFFDGHVETLPTNLFADEVMIRNLRNGTIWFLDRQ